MITRICTAVVMLSWIAFAVVFVTARRRVHRARQQDPTAEAGRQSDPFGSWGFLLQGLGYAMVFFRKWSELSASPAALIAAAVLAPLSIALAVAAVRHLGMQWRIKAVVTRSHKLVQTGPYSFVRHPIYTAMLGMLIATGLLLSTWQVLLVAFVVFAFGTEIRIRAEEGLLEDRFGSEFRSYRSRVRGWIPFVR